MGGWRTSLTRTVRASFARNTLNKLGALCLLSPFASPLIPPFPTHLIHHHNYNDILEHPFTKPTPPAFIFLLCNLIVLAIIITSFISPPTYNNFVPYSFLLHFPFKPIPTLSLTSHPPHIEQPAPLSEIASSIFGPAFSEHWHRTTNSLDRISPSPIRSVARPRCARTRSHQSLSSPQPTTLIANSTLFRSPSHNTYLNLKPIFSTVAPTDNQLTDEEANQRFSTFIEYRFATMKKELMD